MTVTPLSTGSVDCNSCVEFHVDALAVNNLLQEPKCSAGAFTFYDAKERMFRLDIYDLVSSLIDFFLGMIVYG